ncbi:hypothetical protein [Methanocella sp. MCL-LM]|uniref:hypothetical protein n=1 Tax=Methanocella sp. MCL-LM TaxID=3412035 RepID=UPI003C74C77D
MNHSIFLLSISICAICAICFNRCIWHSAAFVIVHVHIDNTFNVIREICIKHSTAIVFLQKILERE